MNRLKKFFPLLIFAILPLILFWDVTLGGKTMLPADNLFQWEPWASHAAELGLPDQPHNSLLTDLVIENYPWKQFVKESLADGEIPLWNPNLFAGAPFLANGQHGAYYPFSLLFLILPTAAAYGWFTVTQLWLAGATMYLLGRVLKQRRFSAIIAGLIYQGSGFMLVSAAVFPMIISAAAWLPLLLAVIEKIIEKSSSAEHSGKTLPWAALGAAALGIQIFAGHVEITYYTLLLMALYALWRLTTQLLPKKSAPISAHQHPASSPVPTTTLTNPKSAPIRVNQRPISSPPPPNLPTTKTTPTLSAFKKTLKPALWLAATVALGLLLGAIQLLPVYEVGQSNFRQDSASLAQVRDWGFPPRRILTLPLPNFFGNPAHHSYRDLQSGDVTPFTLNAAGQPNPHGAGSSNWGIKNYVEGGIYLGILPLILAAFGLLRRGKRSHIIFFALLAFLALNFIFGSPLYAILYYGLPFINQLHSPFRWVFALSLSVAVLAGFGMDEWLAARRTRLFNPIALLVSASGLFLLLGSLLARPLFAKFEDPLTKIFTALAQAPDAFPSASAFFGYLQPQLLTLSLLLIASGLFLRFTRTRPKLHRLIIPLIILDLLIANWGFHSAADPALLDFKPDLVTWLQAQPGDFRISAYEGQGHKPFNANSGWLYNLPDVRGYDSIIARQYTDYMAVIEPQNELPFNRVQPIKEWEAINSPLLDLLGVKFIISDSELSHAKLKVVWEGEGLRVYENLAVVPRAYTIPTHAARYVDDALPLLSSQDPRSTLFVEARNTFQNEAHEPASLKGAEIIASSRVEVIVSAETQSPTWLALNDSYAPGWKAFLAASATPDDETETPIYRVNGNFRGVHIPEAGNWTIRFRYSPLTFKLGGLGSFMGTIIVAFAFGVWSWRQFYKPQGEMSNTQSIAKNSMVPMALNLFNKLIDFVFALFYLRLLGPAQSGAYATAIAIAIWFEIVANWGLNTLIIREVAQDKRRAASYLLNTTILRLFTIVIGALPVILYIVSIQSGGNPLSPQITTAILLLSGGMLISGISSGLAGLFYAYEAAEYPAALATVTTILKVGFGVAVLLAGYAYVGLAAVSILVNLLTLLMLIVVARRKFDLSGPWHIDLPLQRKMFRAGYPLMLNHLLATIFWQIDVPLLRQFNGEAVVGWYNAAYKWVNAFNVIPSFFTFALFPIISRQVNTSLSDAHRTFRQSIKLLVIVALPLAAITTLLANVLIGTLGGPEFLPDGAIALRLVIWSIPIGWINSVTNYVVISLGMEKRLTWAFLVGVSFNFFANLLLLPRFSYVGAALTTIGSEIILLFAFYWFVRQKMPPLRWRNLLGKTILSTLIMGVAMWLGTQVNLLLAVILGVLSYPAALLLLGVFGPEEKRILAKIIPARFQHLLR